MAWDYAAAITGPDGEPLIVYGTGALGWTFESGPPVRDGNATVEHYVLVHDPDSLVGKVASSWARGTANGADYVVYATSRRWDRRSRQPPPHDWADSFAAILVRVR